MTWLALHPWTKQLAIRIEQAMRWERAQRNIDQALREAQLSAQAEADAEMRKAQVQSATTCGCANCRDFLQQQTAGRN